MPQQGGANAPYTRLRGPLLVGQSSDGGAAAAVNGGSTAPLISFWNASEHGLYAESSSITRYATGGAGLILSSAGLHVGTTILQVNTAVNSYLVIPQTTMSMSSQPAPPASILQGGAALMWENGNSTGTGRLWVYSTVNANWMASTAMLFTSTST